MGSLFNDIGKVIKQTAWDQPIGIAKDVVKGDFGGAFNQFTDTFGDNNRALSEVFNDIGIRGKIGDNPQEAIGAAVGTVLGGWVAAPAMGAGAVGTASATGAGLGAGTGAASAMTYLPTASAALGGSGATTGASALGTLGWGGTAGTLGSSIGTGAAAFSPAAGSAMAYMPTQSAVLGGTGSGASSAGASTLDTVMNQLSNLPKRKQQNEQQPIQMPRSASRGYNPIKGFGSVHETGRW